VTLDKSTTIPTPTIYESIDPSQHVARKWQWQPSTRWMQGQWMPQPRTTFYLGPWI
jgi:hypothetical protein